VVTDPHTDVIRVRNVVRGRLSLSAPQHLSDDHHILAVLRTVCGFLGSHGVVQAGYEQLDTIHVETNGIPTQVIKPLRTRMATLQSNASPSGTVSV